MPEGWRASKIKQEEKRGLRGPNVPTPEIRFTQSGRKMLVRVLFGGAGANKDQEGKDNGTS